MTPERLVALIEQVCIVELESGDPEGFLEDGGFVKDHLSDILPPEEIQAIPKRVWRAAWEILDADWPRREIHCPTSAPGSDVAPLRRGEARCICECVEEHYYGLQPSWLSADAIECSSGRRLARAELVERACEIWDLYNTESMPVASERKGFEEWLGKWGKQVSAALDWEDDLRKCRKCGEPFVADEYTNDHGYRVRPTKCHKCCGVRQVKK